MNAIPLQHQNRQIILHNGLIILRMDYRFHHIQNFVIVILKVVEVVSPQRDFGGRAGAVSGGDDNVGTDEGASAEVLVFVLEGGRVGIARFWCLCVYLEQRCLIPRERNR